MIWNKPWKGDMIIEASIFVDVNLKGFLQVCAHFTTPCRLRNRN
ncbi:MAG: hypothetical protein ABIN89_15225 [Chitinophagaceae bacterium]